ncbi:UDP-3-O-glucosamine N-acyltransferase [Agrocybe pediades]|nr:UDP-3-O-glucosamine N-acyltransferase [Agrocybe pediades]
MDLDIVKPDLVTREFLAVLFAGFGTDLAPLTSDYGDEPCPKSLLPVANKPLLEYVLSWLEHSGIKDVLLICPASHRSSVYHHIHSDVSSSSLRIDLQTYDESLDDNIGTCTLLRQFANRISEDFVVLPCDFIPPPDLPLSLLLNKFRVDTLSDGCLATTCWYPSRTPEKGTHIEEWGPLPTTTSIVWDPATSTLLHVDTPDDKDRNAEELELKMSLLSRHPHLKLSTSLEDSHVYVCRRSVLDLLAEKPSFTSLREEFIPWLCKIQYRQSKRAKYGKAVEEVSEPTSQSLSLRHSSLLYIPSPEDSEEAETRLASQASFRVGLIVHRNPENPPMRINTLHSFYEMNKRILGTTTYSLPSNPKDRALIDQRAQISADSIVGESTQISERTTIKRSIIGRHCIIGKMVKITSCVLLDHCVIEDGAKLDNCILGKNTQVGSRAELTKCVTQAGYEVAAGEIVKGEKLEVSDWMATPDGNLSEDSADTEE